MYFLTSDIAQKNSCNVPKLHFFLLYSQSDNENSWQTKAKPHRNTLLCGRSLTPKTTIKSWRTVPARSTNHIAPRKCLLQSQFYLHAHHVKHVI